MDAVELQIHRSNTLTFILANPSVLSLTPTGARVRTPSGGWSEPDVAPRGPQTFRVIELGQRSTPPIVRTQDGKDRQVNFWLLGTWDANMEIGDHWKTTDGREWEIADMIIDNGYERRGLVVERGRGRE